MAKTINNSQLTPDNIYLVQGKVGFSRIARQTTDEERKKDNARRQHPIDKNYTHLSIYDAHVIAKDPNNPSVEDRYAAESLYRSSSPNYPGNNFTGINKSKFLPKVCVINPEKPGTYDEIIPEGELDSGLDVTLVMRVFKGQGSNNGVSLDRVLVNEPIRYFRSNSHVDEALASMGITFNAISPSATIAAEAIANEEASGQTSNAQPAAAPADPAVDNPFSTYAKPTAEPAADSPFAPPPAPNPTVEFGPGRQY